MKYVQTMAWWLMLNSVAVTGCDQASRATPKKIEQPGHDAPYVSAVAAVWRPHQTVTGRVVLRRQVTLRAMRGGRVAQCPWHVGQVVERGQVLLRLRGPRIDGPRRMLQDEMKILHEQQAKSQADMHRFSVMLEKELISGDDKGLIAARSVVREQALAIDKVQDELEQLEAAATVTIPVDGTIVDLMVRDGGDVAADQALAVLSVPSDLAIEAPVFPRHGVRVRTGTRVDVRLDAHHNPIARRVDYLLPQAERRSGATIIGIFPGEGAGRLRPGQRVKMDLLGDEINAVVVPSSAVVSRAGRTYCVKRSDDGWKAVEVRVLDSDGGEAGSTRFAGGRTFLSDGLKPGDEVVGEGAYGIIYRDFRELFTFED